MLREKILSGNKPIHLYGFSPPKAGNSLERNREIASKQIERIDAMKIDGIVLYDIQDEPGRTSSPRPFAFLPTLDPLKYSRDLLAGTRVPKIIYKRVAGETQETLGAWLSHFDNAKNEDLVVLVGSPIAGKPQAHEGTLTLKEACRFAAQFHPTLCLGGVAIAERHTDKRNEQDRLFAKYLDGCRFFVTQTVYDVISSKALIADYARRFSEAGQKAPPLLFSFSPCGSVKTMEFMQWLGIRFPSWLQSELRYATNILGRSIDLCIEIADELAVFAKDHGVPTGFNVESVSIRQEEIDASCVLLQKLIDGPFKVGQYPNTSSH